MNATTDAVTLRSVKRALDLEHSTPFHEGFGGDGPGVVEIGHAPAIYHRGNARTWVGATRNENRADIRPQWMLLTEIPTETDADLLKVGEFLELLQQAHEAVFG